MVRRWVLKPSRCPGKREANVKENCLGLTYTDLLFIIIILPYRIVTLKVETGVSVS